MRPCYDQYIQEGLFLQIRCGTTVLFNHIFGANKILIFVKLCKNYKKLRSAFVPLDFT